MVRADKGCSGAFIVAGVLAIGIICPAGSSSVVAQAPQAPAGERRFDVASVKPAPPLRERIDAAARAGGPPPTVYDMRALPGGRFTATMVSLRMLVSYAFDLRDYQIEGGPAWSSTDYFDIAASAGSDVPPEDIRAMLRTLLIERFRMRARLETRQAPVHVLSLARSDGRLGPELKQTTPECERQLAEQKNQVTGQPAAPSSGRSSITQESPAVPTCGRSRLQSMPTGAFKALWSGVPLTQLVSLVSSAVRAPVIDRTGLSGLFDLTLEYMGERPLVGRTPGQDPIASEIPPPPIATALQQQLGLKLEKGVGPLPIVVIDGAERPLPD